MTNPLIDQGSLLNWPAIKTEHITPALDELLAKANEAVAKVTAPETPATWSGVVDPLEQALEKLSRAWSAVGHLSGVMDSEALREAYNANLPRMTQFYIELSQNEALFAKYKAIDVTSVFRVRNLPPNLRLASKLSANRTRPTARSSAKTSLTPPTPLRWT